MCPHLFTFSLNEAFSNASTSSWSNRSAIAALPNTTLGTLRNRAMRRGERASPPPRTVYRPLVRDVIVREVTRETIKSRFSPIHSTPRSPPAAARAVMMLWHSIALSSSFISIILTVVFRPKPLRLTLITRYITPMTPSAFPW